MKKKRTIMNHFYYIYKIKYNIFFKVDSDFTIFFGLKQH